MKNLNSSSNLGIYSQKLVFEYVGRIIAESLFENWQDKSVSLVLDDAKMRYAKLIKK